MSLLQVECWDSEWPLSVKGLPCDRQWRNPIERIVVSGLSPAAVLPPMLAPIRFNLPKRVYSRREVEIVKYGIYPNGPGYRAIAAEARPRSYS